LSLTGAPAARNGVITKRSNRANAFMIVPHD
jgi:hypothetical protein